MGLGTILNKILKLFSLRLVRIQNKKSDTVKADVTKVYFEKQAYLESNEFKYILWIDRVYEKIRETPGHIVELGVAYGRNAIIFSHLINMNGEESVRKYIGFDTFSGYNPKDLKDNKNLSKESWSDNSKEKVLNRLKKAGVEKQCELIEGDILKSVPNYVKNNPHLRIALLYVDCNAYKPAIEGMRVLKQYMSPNSIICIDEKRQGGETKALIEFCEENNLRFMKDSTPFSIPAYTKI